MELWAGIATLVVVAARASVPVDTVAPSRAIAATPARRNLMLMLTPLV
jgi:hypothetical protein